MSTRSIIAKQNADGSFKAIYCHWNGEPAHNGAILVKHYTDEKKIDQLIKLGDLSTLGPDIGLKHNFDSHINNWCTAYGRDRGEKGTRALRYKDVADIFEEDRGQSYVYIWRRARTGIAASRWSCYDNKGKPINMEELE